MSEPLTRDAWCGESLAGHMQGLCHCVEIAALRQQLAAMTAERDGWHGDVWSHLQALCEKQAEVNGLERQLEAVTAEKEAQYESMLWSSLPAMAEARLTQLVAQLTAMTAERDDAVRIVKELVGLAPITDADIRWAEAWLAAKQHRPGLP